jgi:hypothetical protein
MPQEFNPYAPPRAALEKEENNACWREDKLLVMQVGSTLPPRCVKCNQPAVTPIKTRKIYWHHPGWYVLFFLSVPIYIIVAIIVRKKADISPALCEAHRNRRRLFLAIGWGGFLLGLGLVFVGIAQHSSGWGITGAISMLIFIIVGMIGSRIVFPARITKEQVRLKGCGKAFLDSLPQISF